MGLIPNLIKCLMPGYSIKFMTPIQESILISQICWNALFLALPSNKKYHNADTTNIAYLGKL